MKQLVVACLTIMAIPAIAKLGAQNRDLAGGAPAPMVDGKDHKLGVPAGAILNYADSFHVDRYDRACAWTRIPWKSPGPGTSSYLAEVRNRDCFGVIYNVTSRPRGVRGAPAPRAAGEVPAPTKPFGVPLRDADYVVQASENVVEMEGFTVPRGANGRCDWDKAQTRRKQRPVAESAYQGERHERTCNGVMYFYAIPKAYQVGGDSLKPGPGRSVSVGFPPSLWEGPDTLKGRGREARDIVNLVLPHLRPGSRIDGLMIEDEKLAVVRVFTAPSTNIEYWLDKKDGRWVLSPKERVSIYHPPPRPK